MSSIHISPGSRLNNMQRILAVDADKLYFINHQVSALNDSVYGYQPTYDELTGNHISVGGYGLCADVIKLGQRVHELVHFAEKPFAYLSGWDLLSVQNDPFTVYILPLTSISVSLADLNESNAFVDGQIKDRRDGETSISIVNDCVELIYVLSDYSVSATSAFFEEGGRLSGGYWECIGTTSIKDGDLSNYVLSSTNVALSNLVESLERGLENKADVSALNDYILTSGGEILSSFKLTYDSTNILSIDTHNIAIGLSSKTSNGNAIAIGRESVSRDGVAIGFKANARSNSIAIGNNAVIDTNALSSIQLGEGKNYQRGVLKVFDTVLLSNITTSNNAIIPDNLVGKGGLSISFGANKTVAFNANQKDDASFNIELSDFTNTSFLVSDDLSDYLERRGGTIEYIEFPKDVDDALITLYIDNHDVRYVNNEREDECDYDTTWNLICHAADVVSYVFPQNPGNRYYCSELTLGGTNSTMPLYGLSGYGHSTSQSVHETDASLFYDDVQLNRHFIQLSAIEDKVLNFSERVNDVVNLSNYVEKAELSSVIVDALSSNADNDSDYKWKTAGDLNNGYAPSTISAAIMWNRRLHSALVGIVKMINPDAVDTTLHPGDTFEDENFVYQVNND